MCEICDYDEHVELGFVRKMETHPGAEDVKTVRFVADRGAVDVDITDESMEEFLEIAERVNMEIRWDMAEIQQLLNGEDPAAE